MGSHMQQNRNIPYMWDIFGKSVSVSRDEPASNNVIKEIQKLKLDNNYMNDTSSNDSAISVGSTSDEESYFNGNCGNTATTKRRKHFGVKSIPCESEVKYLERHLSMKKTIRKKIMRDLQKAFVEDPNEFRVEDIPPEQLKAEINLQSLSFSPAGKKKDKKSNESNFLDFLRTGSGLGENKINSGNNKNSKIKGYKDIDGDSGRGSLAADEAEEEDRKTSFWKRFTMKGAKNKR